jgi:hypothetical protein
MNQPVRLGVAPSFDQTIEPTLLMKIEKGLPITAPEYGRLAVQMIKHNSKLIEHINIIVERVNEIEESLHGSRLDSDPTL